MKHPFFVLMLLLGLNLSAAYAQPVLLREATATQSQTSGGTWLVDYAVDDQPVNTGWALGQFSGAIDAETAVFETAQDIGFSGGTELRFRLTSRPAGGQPHNLGRFRLSITRDPRSEFADGLDTDGDVTANWEVLEPITYTALGGAVLTRLMDNSILASGRDANTEVYTIVARTDGSPITGIRLEALEDPSLPENGPGRGPGGNQVLYDFGVQATPVVVPFPVALQEPTATHSQTSAGSWLVDYAVDGDPVNTGWALGQLSGNINAETAVFETARDISFPGGTELRFRLVSRVASGVPHNLGRFRLSVTRDPRSEFADGLDSGGDVTANWEVLVPSGFFAQGGAILTLQPDNSILASGPNANSEIYTVVARTSPAPITGIRLEAMEDARLPGNGPGRGPGGNQVLYDLTITAAPQDLISTVKCSHVDICWEGTPNVLYQVQYTSTLGSNSWVDFGPPVVGNGTNCVVDVIRGTDQRNYRIIHAQ